MSALDRLEAILEREREVLLTGKVADLGALVEAKEDALERISTLTLEQDARLEAVLAKAQRNAALIAASARGVETALGQVRQAIAQADQTTYGMNGARTRLVERVGKVERKC